MSRMGGEECVRAEVPGRAAGYLAKWILLCGVLAAASGCGPDKPTLVPISGKVMLNGKPLHVGSIQFISDGARPAYGTIAKDGSFTLETDGEPGCPIGTHKVVVHAQEFSGSEATGEQVRQITPLIYGMVEFTDISVNVSEPKSDMLIELKGTP